MYKKTFDCCKTILKDQAEECRKIRKRGKNKVRVDVMNNFVLNHFFLRMQLKTAEKEPIKE